MAPRPVQLVFGVATSSGCVLFLRGGVVVQTSRGNGRFLSRSSSPSPRIFSTSSQGSFPLTVDTQYPRFTPRIYRTLYYICQERYLRNEDDTIHRNGASRLTTVTSCRSVEFPIFLCLVRFNFSTLPPALSVSPRPSFPPSVNSTQLTRNSWRLEIPCPLRRVAFFATTVTMPPIITTMTAGLAFKGTGIDS